MASSERRLDRKLPIDATAAELSERAARRFARWDRGTWAAIVSGPARRLASRLPSDGAADALLRSYLELVCEGVGRGYVYPATAGCDTFFNHAFTRLVPELLPSVPGGERAAALAACFNLGENLEAQPAWLRRIFARAARDLTSLARLEDFVADVTRLAVDPPPRILDGDIAVRLVPMAAEDARFLPGAMHFLAPAVLCVHDRLRIRAGSIRAVTLAAWLKDPPLPLGPLGCDVDPPLNDGSAATRRRLYVAAARDPRITARHCVVENEWRAACSLVTSQQIVVLVPA